MARGAGLLVLGALSACGHQETTTAPPAPAAQAESIGTATMEADGTLVLQLRATTGSTMGDALLRYAPSDPQYKAILDHVGPIKPGESKAVAPFP